MGRKIRGRFGSYCTLVRKPKNAQLATSSSVGLTPEHLYVNKQTFFAHLSVSILIKNPTEVGLNNSLLPSPLLIHYVHSYFKAEAHFLSSWFSPHNVSPVINYKRCCLLGVFCLLFQATQSVKSLIYIKYILTRYQQ